MTEPFIVDGFFGRVELQGEGPWSVHEYGNSSYQIIDGDRRDAKPTVHRKIPHSFTGSTKSAANVVWANGSVPKAIVAAANEAWAKRSA